MTASDDAVQKPGAAFCGGQLGYGYSLPLCEFAFDARESAREQVAEQCCVAAWVWLRLRS